MNKKRTRVAIRFISDCTDGYIINTAEEVERLIKDLSGKEALNKETIDLVNPNRRKEITILSDDEYLFDDFFEDILKAIELRDHVEASDFVTILLEINQEYLIMVDNSTISFNKIADAFNIRQVTAYLNFVYGRGEVYRGDGLKISMKAEIGVRHNEAHVHVEGKDGRSATMRVNNENNYEGNLNNKELKNAKRIICENREMLISIWEKLQQGISISIDYSLGRIKFHLR